MIRIHWLLGQDESLSCRNKVAQKTLKAFSVWNVNTIWDTNQDLDEIFHCNRSHEEAGKCRCGARNGSRRTARALRGRPLAKGLRSRDKSIVYM
jgi:hypothetical protein